jgi:uncharacterized protein
VKGRVFLFDPDNGLLLYDEKYPLVLYKQEKALKRSFCISHLTLNVARTCNLACRYCWVKKLSSKNSLAYMPKKVGEGAIDFLIRASEEEPNLIVTFFGGEPLLNFGLIEHVIRYGRQRAGLFNKRITFSITTNGTLLTEYICQFLAENKVKVVISLDGTKPVHNFLRPFPNGRGSYDIILSGLMRLIDSKVFILAEATITRYNLEVERIIEHLLKLGFPEVYTMTVRGPQDCSLTADDLNILKEEYTKATYHFLEEALKPSYWGWNNLKNLLKQFYTNSKIVNGCPAGRSRLNIDIDGNIYPCFNFIGHKEFCLGNVNSHLDETAREEFIAATKLECRQPCMNCWARYICGGECYYESYEHTGSFSSIKGEQCELNKHLVELALWCFWQINIKDEKIFPFLFNHRLKSRLEEILS